MHKLMIIGDSLTIGPPSLGEHIESYQMIDTPTYPFHFDIINPSHLSISELFHLTPVRIIGKAPKTICLSIGTDDISSATFSESDSAQNLKNWLSVVSQKTSAKVTIFTLCPDFYIENSRGFNNAILFNKMLRSQTQSFSNVEIIPVHQSAEAILSDIKNNIAFNKSLILKGPALTLLGQHYYAKSFIRFFQHHH